MSNKIEKSSFVRDILIFQGLYEPNITESTFEFERQGIDGIKHIYTGVRSLKDGKFEFRLKQDEIDVTYQAKSEVSFDTIVDEVGTWYRTKSVPLPRDKEDWETYFRQLGYVSLDLKPELEILAAWLDFYTRAGWTTRQDLSKILEYKFPDSSPKKLAENFLYAKNNDEIKEEGIKSINTKENPKTLVLTSNISDLSKMKENEIYNLFRRRTSELFKERIANIDIPISSPENHLVLETSFREQLKTQIDRLYKKIPKEIESQYGNLSNDNKTNPEVFKLKDYLFKTIEAYAVDTEAKGVTKPYCFLIEAPIGMGKTTFSIDLFTDLAEKYYSRPLNPIPLIVFTGDVKGQDFQDLIEKDYREHLEFIKSIRNSTNMKSRKLIVIIDGLDECRRSTLIPPILDVVKELISDKVFVVLTSRPIEDITSQVNKKIPETKTINLVSKKEIDWSLVGFPSSSRGRKRYIEDFFEYASIIESIQSPLFINLMNGFLSQCGKISKKWLTDPKFPITLNRMLIEFYKRLRKHAVDKGALENSVALDDIIKAGKILAKSRFLDEFNRKDEYSFDLLRKVGLTNGSNDKPQFIHLLYEYDFLSRAIATGEPELTAQNIFDILRQSTRYGFSIGEHALQMVERKESFDYVENKVVSINHPNFDVFANLYEDNAHKFTKLKAKTWALREKGMTPYLKFVYENLQSDELSWDEKSILQDLHPYYPDIQAEFIKTMPLRLVLQTNILPENLDILISRIENTIEEEDLKFINQIPKVILLSENVFVILEKLFPSMFYDEDLIILISLLFKKEAESFNLHLFQKIMGEYKDKTLCSPISYLDRYLKTILQNPIILPCFKTIHKNKQLVIQFFDEIISKYKLNTPYYRNSDSPNNNFLSIIFNILDFLEDSLDVNQNEKFFEALDGISDKELIVFLEKNPSHWKSLIRYFENTIQNHGEWFMKKYFIVQDYLSLIIDQSDSFDEILHSIKNQDLLAIMSNPYHIKRFKPPISISDNGIIMDTQNQENDHNIDKYNAISKKLKTILKKEDDKRYKGLIQYSKYEFFQLPKEPIYIYTYLDRNDMKQLDIPLFLEKYNENLFELSEQARDYLFQEMITIIKNKGDLNKFNIRFSGIFGTEFTFDHISMLEFIQCHLSKFSEYLDIVEQSENCIKTFIDLFTPDTTNDSVIDAVWSSILEELKTIDDSSDLWKDIFSYFVNTSIPNYISGAILKDDSLVEKYVQSIYGTGLAGSSAENLLNEIVATKVDIIKKYLSESSKDYNHKNQTILMLVLKNFNLYSSFIEDRVKSRKQFLPVNLSMKFSEELITYLLKIIPEDRINHVFALIQRQNGTDWARNWLKLHQDDKSLVKFYEQYFPTAPNRWDTRIQACQNSSLKMLEEMGIEIDEDEEY